MAFQPHYEKEAERQLIISFVAAVKSKGYKCEIIKLQEDNDDGKEDGIIEINGKQVNVEVRRKGYPNHKGKTYNFKNGWENDLLLKDGGIFLNELTLNRYKNDNFIYIVDINGFKPRCTYITPLIVNKLLKQPYREQKSTNSGVMQSVKTVPLEWFKEYY